jgi:hypothetical protein
MQTCTYSYVVLRIVIQLRTSQQTGSNRERSSKPLSILVALSGTGPSDRGIQQQTILLEALARPFVNQERHKASGARSHLPNIDTTAAYTRLQHTADSGRARRRHGVGTAEATAEDGTSPQPHHIRGPNAHVKATARYYFPGPADTVDPAKATGQTADRRGLN